MKFTTVTQMARTAISAVLSRLTQSKLKMALALSLFTAFASADSVYVLNGNGQFGTVNLGTGAFQPIGPATPEPGTGLTPGPNGSLLTLDIAGNLKPSTRRRASRRSLARPGLPIARRPPPPAALLRPTGSPGWEETSMPPIMPTTCTA
jgi:hypothetical protein